MLITAMNITLTFSKQVGGARRANLPMGVAELFGANCLQIAPATIGVSLSK